MYGSSGVENQGEKAGYDLFVNLNVTFVVKLSGVIPAEEVEVFKHLLDCSVQHTTTAASRRSNNN